MRREGEKRFVLDDLGVRIKDFALDPSQDFIVLLEHCPAPGSCVHLRKLCAVVAPHPAAKNLCCARCAIGPMHRCMIQIVEDVVGVYFECLSTLRSSVMELEKLLLPDDLSILILSHDTPSHSSCKRIKLQNAIGTLFLSSRA